MRFLFFFITCCFVSAQSIRVLTVKDDQPTFEVERVIIKNSLKMYNFANKDNPLDYKLTNVKDFQTIFDEINAAKGKDRDLVCAIYQITITEARKKKYDFSVPYLPVKESIMCLIDRKDVNYKKKGVKLGYLSSSIQENQFNRLKKFGVIGVPYSSNETKNLGLLKGETDFVFIDNVEAWGRKDVKVAADLDVQNGNGFGILFPKGSELKKKLNPHINKFLETKTFFNLLYKTFGKNVAVQYKESLESSK